MIEHNLVKKCLNYSTNICILGNVGLFCIGQQNVTRIGEKKVLASNLFRAITITLKCINARDQFSIHNAQHRQF